MALEDPGASPTSSFWETACSIRRCSTRPCRRDGRHQRRASGAGRPTGPARDFPVHGTRWGPRTGRRWRRQGKLRGYQKTPQMTQIESLAGLVAVGIALAAVDALRQVRARRPASRPTSSSSPTTSATGSRRLRRHRHQDAEPRSVAQGQTNFDFYANASVCTPDPHLITGDPAARPARAASISTVGPTPRRRAAGHPLCCRLRGQHRLRHRPDRQIAPRLQAKAQAPRHSWPFLGYLSRISVDTHLEATVSDLLAERDADDAPGLLPPRDHAPARSGSSNSTRASASSSNLYVRRAALALPVAGRRRSVAQARGQLDEAAAPIGRT